MKIIMQGRIDLNRIGGGDKVQIENTAKELRKLGLVVDINTNLQTDISSYDIVHAFQLDWTPESYFYAMSAKKLNKPFVLSPIHHSVDEVKKYDDNYAFGFRRFSKILLKNQFARDTLKNIYRSLTDRKKFIPTFKSIFLRLDKMHVETLKMSDIVLVQTNTEAKDLESTYHVKFKWKKIPNGVSESFLDRSNRANPFDFKDYIICVGRIEPRKNQLKIIEAVKTFKEKYKLDTHLVFIGSKNSKRHAEYNMRFNEALKKYEWIKHITNVEYENMPSYYSFAKVCVSASWFETTGLTSLEALYCKTNAVASGARAEEVLNTLVSYCDPSNADSIEKAISNEYFSTRPILPLDMATEYTWKNAALKTLKAYNSILKT